MEIPTPSVTQLSSSLQSPSTSTKLSKELYATSSFVSPNSKNKQCLSSATLESFKQMAVNSSNVNSQKLLASSLQTRSATHDVELVKPILLCISALVKNSWLREGERQSEIKAEMSKIKTRRLGKVRKAKDLGMVLDRVGLGGDAGRAEKDKDKDSAEDEIYLRYLKVQHRLERQKEGDVGERLDAELKRVDSEFEIKDFVERSLLERS